MTTNRMFISTFVCNHPDPDSQNKMLIENINKSVSAAEKDLVDNGFIMDKPDITLVSHNNMIHGIVLA